MVKLAFILLCHRAPEAVARQARALTARGDGIVIHLDGRAPRADERSLRVALADTPNAQFTPKRVRCGWGEWSLVQATLLGVRTALDAFPDATHLYLISGDCAPIKSAVQAKDWLDAQDKDHIESHDFFRSNWIRTGLREDRLRYRHVFNERRQSQLFYASLALQRRLGWDRAMPHGVEMRLGSQWWCLRRTTASAVLKLCDQRRDLVRFFARSWIPDETFFQTLVPMVVPQEDISCRSPTFLRFTDYGMPVAFHDDHREMLLEQDALFARKLAPGAKSLRADLASLWDTDRTAETDVSGAVRQGYLAQAGRRGARTAPRFWEDAARIGQGRAPLLIACKRWDLGRRLIAAIRSATSLPALGYIFNDAQIAGLPELGGLSRSLDQRNRHRRAYLRLLFDHFGADRLVFCIDPCMADAARDLAQHAPDAALLKVDCALTEPFLEGHARRVGVTSHQTARDALASVLPILRRDLEAEDQRLGAVPIARRFSLCESANPDELGATLGAFLGVTSETARAIAATEPLRLD